MNYSMPLWVYGEKLDKAKGRTCCVCGGPLPEPHYTLTCRRCQKKEEERHE